MEIVLPWWASAYLLIAGLFYLAGAADDFNTNKWFSLAGLVSLVFVIIFVVGFFNPEVAVQVGWLVIPMVVFGLIWELFSVMPDIKEFEEESTEGPNMSQKQKEGFINMVLVFNGLLVVPGYFAGIILCLDVLR